MSATGSPTDALPRETAELVERIRAGDTAKLELRGANLQNADLSRLNLSGADLTEAELGGAKLSGTVLANATLFRAGLEGCELLGADLRGANLDSCRADRAGFGGADLRGSTLCDASLHGATLSGAKLEDAELRCADLRDARLRDAQLGDADFHRADLRNADLEGSRTEGADFGDCDLRGARLARLDRYERAGWIGADIRDVDFRGALEVRRFILDENYIHEFRTRSRGSAAIYWIWWATSDCGRSFARWALWVGLIVALFGGVYQLVDVDYGDHPTFLSPVYFSLVTLTTLGYGDALPASVAAQAVAMLEVTVGYVALGGLLSIFANKMSRRAE